MRCGVFSLHCPPWLGEFELLQYIYECSCDSVALFIWACASGSRYSQVFVYIIALHYDGVDKILVENVYLGWTRATTKPKRVLYRHFNTKSYRLHRAG